MAYSAGSTILDDDYNIFATGNAAGTGDNNVANVNTIWGTGTLDKGWGQSSPVTAVSAGSVITATQWTTLLNRCTTIANQTNTSLSSITNPNAGDTITAYAALSTNISNIFTNRNNAAAVGSTITASGAASTSTPWSVSQTFTHTVTFANAASARYFFNAGGRITLSFSLTGYSGAKSTGWFNLLTACGTLNFTTGTSTQTIAGTSYTGTTKTGGSGTPTTLLSGVGFYDLTTSNQEVFKQYDATYLYTANYVTVNVQANAAAGSATVITITSALIDDANTSGAGGTADEQVDGTLTGTVTAIQPSTTYLTNTWGTPTLSASLTGS